MMLREIKSSDVGKRKLKVRGKVRILKDLPDKMFPSGVVTKQDIGRQFTFNMSIGGDYIGVTSRERARKYLKEKKRDHCPTCTCHRKYDDE